MKKYVVEEKPLQAVLDYLATKPYKETVTLIANIQSGNKLFDETKEYTQEQYNKNYDTGYNLGLGVGFEQASNKAAELIKNTPVEIVPYEEYEKESKAAKAAEAEEEIKRLNLEAFSDA